MSIKVEMFIKLPYIIKLNEEKDYRFSFQFNEFEMFDLEMRFNDENNEDIYKAEYPPCSCSNIRIEAIYKNCNYLDYEKRTTFRGDKNINEFIVELPFKETNNIFNVVNKKLEKILSYLRNKSNMFWIEQPPIRPISYCFGNEIEFNFYSPNTKLFKCVKEIKQYTDYYMISDSLEKISNVDNDIFNGFKDDGVEEKFNLYLSKAEKSLYERSYEDFIIYCSIAVEAFIRRYIGKLEPKDDIIFNRISVSNYDYLDQYYNVLLKYIKGKSLIELDENAFYHLKRMYKLRNAIMHNGIVDESALKKAGLNKLDFKECKNILDSAKKSFLIISKL
ncbi:hypothetical protein ACJDT4_12065 [Clostridium neuense]|uniref:Apea-like HEPN domain-containing protein n=1 Tax=Clostridium neuense TaxID=1728934 RepID=A0ABW8TFY2_9CLOT